MIQSYHNFILISIMLNHLIQKGMICIMKKNNDKVTTLLTKTLIELINKEDYKTISISNLCNKAGVGRMSFYRNFNSKDEILVKYITDITYNFIKDNNIVYNEPDFKSYIIALFEHLKENKTLCYNLYKINKLYLIKNIFDEVFIKCNRYNEYKSYYISGSLYNTFYCWVKNDFKETPEEIADLIS
jgi:hypothetical protein